MSDDKPPFKLPRRVSQPFWLGLAILLYFVSVIWRYREGTVMPVTMSVMGAYVVCMWPGTFRPTHLASTGFRVRWRTREVPFSQIVVLKTRWWTNACTATLRDGEKVMLALGGVHGPKRKLMLRWVHRQIAANAFE